MVCQRPEHQIVPTTRENIAGAVHLGEVGARRSVEVAQVGHHSRLKSQMTKYCGVATR